MNFADLIHRIDENSKKIVNKIIKTQTKLSKCESAITFNGLCLKEDLLPKFTNIRLHDPAAKNEAFTKDFRKKLVEEQLRKKESLRSQIQDKLSNLYTELNNRNLEASIKEELLKCLDEKAENCNHANKAKIAKKLSNIYGGTFNLPLQKQGYVNLSSIELTNEQHNFLNLGLNCHIQSKRKGIDKKTELEVLYQDILQLEKNEKVVIKGDLKGELIGEGNKLRGNSNSKLLTKELKEAAKQLRDNDKIIIRRADKSPIFVILDKEEYLRKLSGILSDTTKFQKIKEDPTKKLKAKVNRDIKSANAVIDGVHFQTIVGEFTPGYLYGTVKTHKNGNPLRPIISQVSTSTYKLAKRLNQLLKPYIPAKFCINSADEFLDILRAKQPEAGGILASIDVESLFTNVPINETIDIILDEVYEKRSNGLPALNLSRNILERLLKACTKDAPFRGPDGQLYVQKEGVAMGSPLGPLFANFYMAHVENHVLSDPDIAPSTYVRYVDDCFVDVNDREHLLKLVNEFESNSVLTFTYELSRDDVLPFLDVLVERGANQYHTSVYRKPTNTGQTLNANSECPSRYKTSVIRAFVKRAIRTCSTNKSMHEEFMRLKQLLVNNGYSNGDIDSEIQRQLDTKYNDTNMQELQGTSHHLYYRNFMNTEYEKDERILKHIITKNVECKDKSDKLMLHIYYQSTKTKHLVMKNNPIETKRLMRTNVVYQFDCPSEDCRLQNISYVGYTCTTLSRRLTMHKQEGAIKTHMLEKHNIRLTREHLVENTSIIHSNRDPRRVEITEAIHIRDHTPSINEQKNARLEKLALWGTMQHTSHPQTRRTTPTQATQPD
ncbi:uncharacterized protein LOC122370546 isoform X1 [Amphibalanus amphitrite]|uniref:uncharacterized protein LOC122370546 isoform X1 n=1 Tax=Amphibalanus amphitrite TaxID=1232801 RepID=UPI001C927A9E|nr:uncharacterized protein LOC122370546 isoform X1 [Amphibalanus amphitrite]